MADRGSKYTITFAAESKDLRKTRKEFADFVKEVQKQAKIQRTMELKAHKERLKDINIHQKALIQSARDQKKVSHDSYYQQRRARKEELDHINKVRKETKKQHQEAMRLNQRTWGERLGFGQGGRGGLARRGLRAAAGLGGGVLGMLVGGATSSYDKYLQYTKSFGSLLGSSKNKNIHAILANTPSSAMGFNPMEAVQQAGIMGRATGVLGPREMQFAQRATGMSATEVGNMFSTIRQSGFKFDHGQRSGVSAGAHEFKKIMAAAVYSGLERARAPEFFKGIEHMAKRQGGLSVGRVNVTDFARILGIMGKSGLAGLQGERGAAVAAKLQQAILQPGGGEWGKSFMQMAMGFGKPGSTTGFYEAEKLREQGLTVGNTSRVVKEIISQFGSGEMGSLATRALTGLSLEQSEALLKLGRDGKFSKDEMASLNEIIEGTKSLDKQAVDHLKEMNGDLKRLADRFSDFITLGHDFSKTIEAIQDVQLELFKKIAPALQDIAGGVQEIVSLINHWFNTKEFSEEQRKAAWTQYKQAREQRRILNDPDAARAQVTAEIAAGEKALEAATNPKATWGRVLGGTPKWLKSLVPPLHFFDDQKGSDMAHFNKVNKSLSGARWDEAVLSRSRFVKDQLNKAGISIPKKSMPDSVVRALQTEDPSTDPTNTQIAVELLRMKRDQVLQKYKTDTGNKELEAIIRRLTELIENKDKLTNIINIQVEGASAQTPPARASAPGSRK